MEFVNDNKSSSCFRIVLVSVSLFARFYKLINYSFCEFRVIIVFLRVECLRSRRNSGLEARVFIESTHDNLKPRPVSHLLLIIGDICLDASS